MNMHNGRHYSSKVLEVKTTFIIILSSILISCGGGGSSSDEINSTGSSSNNQTHTWKRLDFKNTNLSWDWVYDSKRAGNNIYFQTDRLLNSAPILKTQDGSTFSEFSPVDSLSTINFVDENNRMYLNGTTDTYISDDGINYTLTSSEVLPEYINGSSTIMLSNYLGIKKSVDGTVSWSFLDVDQDGDANNQDNDDFNEFQLPAFNGLSAFVFISDTTGLYVTQDGGDSWSKKLISETGFQAITGNSNFSTRFYAGKSGKIFESTDTGNSWSEITTPQINAQPISEFLDIELADDGTLFAWGIANNSGQSLGQVFKSDNFGQIWSKVGGPIGESKIIFDVCSICTKMHVTDNYYFMQTRVDVYIKER